MILARLFRRHDTIDVAEAARRLGAGELILIDVREKTEWKNGRARGAIHIPLATIPKHVKALDAHDKPVAFICRSGHRSTAACATARGVGIAAINVPGGMSAWQRAGLPIVKG